MPKNAVRLMNSSKNKINSEIIFIFHSNPNAHLLLYNLGFVKFYFGRDPWARQHRPLPRAPIENRSKILN